MILFLFLFRILIVGFRVLVEVCQVYSRFQLEFAGSDRSALAEIVLCFSDLVKVRWISFEFQLDLNLTSNEIGSSGVTFQRKLFCPAQITYYMMVLVVVGYYWMEKY